MPPPLTTESIEKLEYAIPVLGAWTRGVMGLVAGGLMGVIGVAAWLHPYREDGQPMRLEVHRQLGLPPCSFHFMTGIPCPSCGLTTSIALLIHGNLRGSLQANAVGTLLGLLGLVLIPWSLACAIKGQLYFLLSLERALTWVVLLFTVLLVGRWAIILMVWHVASG